MRIAHTHANIRKRGKIVNDFINGYEAKSWFAMKCKALRGSRPVRKPNIRVQNMRRISYEKKIATAQVLQKLIQEGIDSSADLDGDCAGCWNL